MNDGANRYLAPKPSDASYSYAEKRRQRLNWPIANGTVLSNALHHVNSHGIGVGRRFVNFAGNPVAVDHPVFADATMNALATVHRGIYIAALHYGFYLAILDTAFSIFSSPHVITDIGVPEREGNRFAPTALGMRWTAYPATNDYFDWITQNMPACPVRRDAAHVLAAMMTAVVLHHEQGHIALGHIDILRHERNLAEYAEFAAAGAEPAQKDSLFRNLAELDADRWAVIACLDPTGIRTMQRNYSSVSLSDATWYALAWLGAALVAALLALLDIGRQLDHPEAWLTHPHGLVRAREITSGTLSAQISRARGNDAIAKAQADGSRWMSAIGARWPEFAILELAGEKGGRVDSAITRFRETVEPSRPDYTRLIERYKIRRNPQ